MFYYGLEDQLAAIRALGESVNEKASEFLEHLYQVQIRSTLHESAGVGYSVYQYPWAPLSLRKKLEFRVAENISFRENLPEREVEKDVKRYISTQEHKIIRVALQTVQRAIERRHTLQEYQDHHLQRTF